MRALTRDGIYVWSGGKVSFQVLLLGLLLSLIVRKKVRFFLDALRYLGQGHARGKVVITVNLCGGDPARGPA